MECCIKQIKLVETTTAVANTHSDMIQQEIYLLQNLTHPRIIHLYDYFYSNDNAFVYIVMELAAFGSLSNEIAYRRTQMQFYDEVVSIIACIHKVACPLLSVVLFCSLENQKYADWRGAWHRIFTYEKCDP